MAEFEQEGGTFGSWMKFSRSSELCNFHLRKSISQLYISKESYKLMSEYGDGGAPPAEAEVEDNRPLQERIGDKVKIEYYVVSYWQVLLRNHLLAKFQKLSLCRLNSCATATGRVQSMHREMLKSSTGWLTLHMMVWYWHSFDVSCSCEYCATLLITSRRETKKCLFMPDKICCEIRQKWRWLQRYGWCSTASLSYVRHSSVLCCAVVCCAVMCCGVFPSSCRRGSSRNIYCSIEQLFLCEVFRPIAAMTLYSYSVGISASHHHHHHRYSPLTAALVPYCTD